MSGRRDEDGMVGGFEALPFGFLVLVVGTLLVANAWAVVDAHLAASAAAREAVRAFVESSGDTVSARAQGEAAALDALAGHGRQPSRATVDWRDAELERCRPVTVVVSYRVPTLSLPWIGGLGGGVIETAARHTEVVDPWRAGLPVDGFEPGGCGA